MVLSKKVLEQFTADARPHPKIQQRFVYFRDIVAVEAVFMLKLTFDFPSDLTGIAARIRSELFGNTGCIRAAFRLPPPVRIKKNLTPSKSNLLISPGNITDSSGFRSGRERGWRIVIIYAVAESKS